MIQQAILRWHTDHVVTYEASDLSMFARKRHCVYRRPVLVQPGAATYIPTGVPVRVEALLLSDCGWRWRAVVGWSSCPRRPACYALEDVLWGEVQDGGVLLHDLCGDDCRRIYGEAEVGL